MDSEATSPVVSARFIDIDLPAGSFDDPRWDDAAPVLIHKYWNGDSAPSSRSAEAKILWSDKALHVRFVCEQAEPVIAAETFQTGSKTMGLWDRDVCEIFLAPDPNAPENYFELEAAPTGEWLDVAIRWTPEKRESNWDFDSHMTTAARIERDRFTVTLRIPWGEEIHRPARGERWRVNLFRCIGKNPNRGYLAWQPTKTPTPGFHLPAAFGWLSFE